MSTLHLPAERAASQATTRIQSGRYPPLRVVSLPTVETKPCLNCDAPLGGKFCQHCGQPAKVKRYTFGAFLHELPHELLHLDHALPHTLKALLTKPGSTIRAYLDGKRARIYSPIALLFLLSGLVALVTIALKLTGPTTVVATGDITIATGTEKLFTTAASKIAE